MKRLLQAEDGGSLPSGPRVVEILGPWNNPELILPKQQQEQRGKARFAFSQLCWQFRENRIAASIGYQAAKAHWREVQAGSSAGAEARYRLLRLKEDADEQERVNLEFVDDD
jgi:hypothetical protein